MVWVSVTCAALLAPQPRLLGTVGASWAAYFLAGGSIRHGDTPLVGALKEGFHRARPADHAALHTFAYPRCPQVSTRIQPCAFLSERNPKPSPQACISPLRATAPAAAHRPSDLSLLLRPSVAVLH